MSKKKKKSKLHKPKTTKKSGGFFSNLTYKKQVYLFFASIMLLLMIYYAKMMFGGLEPPATDTIAYKTKYEPIRIFKEENNRQPYWHPYMFSGMPSFGSFICKTENPQHFLYALITAWNRGWRYFWWFFTIAIAMYILLLRKKLHPFAAAVGTSVFLFTPHIIGMVDTGHSSKLASSCFIPLVFLAFDYLLEKPNLKSCLLAALALAAQLWAGHPQIAYYTWLALGIWWLYTIIIKWIDVKKFMPLAKITIFMIIAFTLCGIMILNPYLMSYEYGKNSIRGGGGETDTGGGLDRDYATSWSFHPAEMLTFFVPSTFGFANAEYWGWMPFTQSNMYMGFVALILAILGLVFARDKILPYLVILAIISLLISFGRHFTLLSDFLLRYLPFFNKFRVPAMILILLEFIIGILAAFGIDFFIKNYQHPKEDFVKLERTFIIISGLLLFSLLILYGFKEDVRSWMFSFMFTKAGDVARYGSQLSYVQTKRFVMFLNDYFTMRNT